MSRLRSFLTQIGVLTLSFAPIAVHAQVSDPASSVLPTAPAAAVTVSLPQDLAAAAGAEFVLPLTVSDGTGIGSFAISVIYDPAKVTYVKAIESEDTQGFRFVDGELDAEGGLKERIIGGSSATKLTKTGPVVLTNITFAAKAGVTGAVEFRLNNPLDDIANATLQNGSVVVGAAAPTTPSEPEEPVPSLPVEEPIEEPTVTDAPIEVDAPLQLDETGPVGILALLSLSGGLAYALRRRRA